jgi:neurotransmitter:Na+ symporter, NSS family
MTAKQKRFGLYFISMVTAYGLGNIWRFPYLVFDYGKGSFLLLFCFLCFFIGVPLIVTEVLLGKSFHGRDYESSSHILKSIFFKTKFPILWWMPSIITLLVMSYYTLISCWIMHYISRLFYAQITKSGFAINNVFADLMNRPVLLILLSSVHVLIIYLFLNKGEKLRYRFWISGVFPILTFILGYIAYQYFTVEDVVETAKTLLYPNFFMLRRESLNFAIGHMLFTLSLGFGTLIGAGQNLNSDLSTTSTSARLGLTDSAISILLLAALFPMVLNTEFQGRGSEILFYVIPGYFSEHGLSLIMACSLYLLIYLCSLTASLGLMESLSSNIFESTRLSKSKSHSLSCLLVFGLGVLFIGFSEFSNSHFLKSLGFDLPDLSISQVVVLVDDALINFILPISVIIGLRAALSHLDSEYVKNDFSINEGLKAWPYYLYWKFIIKIGFPLLFLISLILRFVL